MLDLFLRYILPALVFAGTLSFGVHKYNDGIREKAVAAALKDERAITQPVIDELAKRVADRDSAIDEINAVSKAEKLRQQEQLELKQKGYDHAIANTKTLKNRLDAMRGNDADFERLLNNTTTANGSPAEASLGDRYERLETAHQQCERDIRHFAETAAGTIERLGAAVAAIDALKN